MLKNGGVNSANEQVGWRRAGGRRQAGGHRRASVAAVRWHGRTWLFFCYELAKNGSVKSEQINFYQVP